MHDKDKTNRDKNPTTRKYHNLVPEMARVGIQIWHVTYGVLLKEICPRGNNNVIILFPYIMISVYYSC